MKEWYMTAKILLFHSRCLNSVAVNSKNATSPYTKDTIPYQKKEECKYSRLLTVDLQVLISPDYLNRPKTEQDDDNKVA